VAEKKTPRKTGNGIGIKTAFLAIAVFATAAVVFYFGAGVQATQASVAEPAAHKPLASKSLSLPMFFEPNQGQTAPQVKFLARGSGYGLFLTAEEAVLRLQPARPDPRTASASPEHTASSVIRMRLDGANSTADISGAEPLPGRSNYFIGNDPAKWRRNIPQFARVQYKSVYPGVDLVYYGDQGQLEYDFRVAPGANPNQIAISFSGASAHIATGVSGDPGDLILSTASGEVRFHAPRVYQPATPEFGKSTENSSGNAEKAVAGSFRQLADNKIGFTVGDYDHSRELVIDPVLSYSTYLGGTGTESLVKVAVDNAQQIYLAGSTNSTYFFPPPNNPNNPPLQNQLGGPDATNIFIAVLNTNPNVPVDQQLVYATYLGGSLVDSLAGIAVDKNRTIYVAGSTTSYNSFPITTSNALNPGPVTVGTHGFLSTIALDQNSAYTLTYSTYLAGTNTTGNSADTVTGLAIDQNQNAYVTGTTTSTNSATQFNPFPASPNGYQTVSNNPGGLQFFASKINTAGSGYQSMLYSTYFGGGYPATAIAIGGGIAVDPSGTNSVNMYITGTTTMLNALPNGVTAAPFPLFNAQKSCLNEAGKTNCPGQTQTTTPDAFVAKINPNNDSLSSLVYSTYIGGSGDDYGNAIDVDTSGNAYVTGSTDSTDWVSSGNGFQLDNGGGLDAFIVKIGGSIVGTVYPINYFSYLGGSGNDSGQDIKVDSIGAVHLVGSTTSPNKSFPTLDPLQPVVGGSQYNGGQYGGEGDAFVALIGTTLSGQGAGDYVTYLGGSALDQGTGIAFDIFGATYAAGTTLSSNFPITSNTAYQPQLNGTSPNAFVTKIGANSTLVITVPSTSPSPYPAVAAGNQVAFTFDIANFNQLGTDPANQVVFNAVGLPTTGLASPVTAKVTSGSGTCGGVTGSTISCSIPTLAVCTAMPCTVQASVEVDITPAVPVLPGNSQISIAGNASANGGAVGGSVPQPVENVTDFVVSASTSTPVINAGDTATIQVAFCPATNLGYSGTITPSQTTNPSMVTSPAPTFNPTSVTLSGGCLGTTLSIATVPRPVTTGSLFRRGSFYAAWLPVGGLSLVGLGIGAAGRKRRRWLAGAALGLIAGVILLQPGCGSASNTTTATGGTLAGVYTITITGSAGTAATHNTQVRLQVN